MDDDYTNFTSDFAIDEIQYTSSAGTVTTYDFDSTAGMAAWQHTGNVAYTSTNAAAIGTHNQSLSTSGYNMRWRVDPGGPTPSSNTGPSSAANGNSTKNYLYFEASAQSGNTIRPTSVRMVNAFTAN
jgi:hypothetical protein